VQLPCQAEQRLKNAGVAKKMVRRSRKSRAKGWDFFPMGGAVVVVRLTRLAEHASACIDFQGCSNARFS
jgi:hypothetical protein